MVKSIEQRNKEIGSCVIVGCNAVIEKNSKGIFPMCCKDPAHKLARNRFDRNNQRKAEKEKKKKN